MEPLLWWTGRQRELQREASAFAESLRGRSQEIAWSSEYPWDVMEMIADRGWLGACIPEEYGGTASRFEGAASLAILSEELGRVPQATWPFPVTAFGGTTQIVEHASHEQKQRWLPKIANGESTGAVCVTEPFTGSDATSVETTATRCADGYRLNGKKRFITNIGAAGHYLVYAVVDSPERDGLKRERKHLSVFYVESGAAGLTVEKYHDLGGHEYVRNGILDLKDVVVSGTDRIGAEGDGWRILTSGLNLERILVAAGGIGIMREALYYGGSWTNRRVQFGKPVDQLQLVQSKLSNAVSRIRSDRLMVHYAAHLLDNGEQATLDATVAKLLTATDGMNVCMDMVQVMGGDGVSRYYPVEQLARSMKVKGIGGGSNEVLTGLVYRQAVKSMGAELQDDITGYYPPSRREIPQGVHDSGDPDTRVLLALADVYVTDPGLHARLTDLEARTRLEPAELKGAVDRLLDAGHVKVSPSAGTVKMVRPTFEGLRQARPREWFRINEPEFIGPRELITEASEPVGSHD